MEEYCTLVDEVSHSDLAEGDIRITPMNFGKIIIGRVGVFSFYHISLTNANGLQICLSGQPVTEIRLIGLLEGDAISTGYARQFQRLLSAEHNCVMVEKNSSQRIAIEGDGPAELVLVAISHQQIGQLLLGNQSAFLDFLNRGQGGWMSENGNLPMGVEQMAVIRHALHEEKLPYLRQAFMQVKMAEWYLLFFEQAVKLGGRGDFVGLRPEELERIRQVQYILHSNPAASYSLVGLAHLVGTNEATLKKHFKLVYGTTVFGYLTACRMERAKALLVNEKLKVALVAQEVGYKYASHFSAAFRKYYGYLPAKLLRKMIAIPSFTFFQGLESMGLI